MPRRRRPSSPRGGRRHASAGRLLALAVVIAGPPETGAAPLLGQAPASGDASAAGGTSAVFDVQPVVPGVWAAVLREKGPFPVTNSLIVVSDEGVLVADTQQSEEAVREVIAWIRAHTDRPVRWVVNSHAHLDHVGGNDAYVTAFGPDVTVLGHARTAEGVDVATRASLAREVERRGAALAEQRARLERIRGNPLLGAALEADMERGLAAMEAYLAGLRGLALRPPEVTFETDTVLRLGDREVWLLHPGPAHTRGDVVVWIPADGVLFAGDLLEEGISIVGEGATPGGWAAALDSLARLDVRHLIPAHGPVQGRGLLDRQRDLFGGLVREVWAARAAGASMDEAWGPVARAAEAALADASGRLPVPRAILLAWLEAALPRVWLEVQEAP